MGRPSDFSQVIADEICERIGKGETLASICRDDRMPAVRTVSDWKKAHQTFSADFACAREEGFDALAEECLAIADDSSRDVKVVGEDEHEVCNTEFVQRAKLRIDTRLKLLAKWDPKRYGEKLQLGGDEGGAPIKHEFSWLPSGS